MRKQWMRILSGSIELWKEDIIIIIIIKQQQIPSTGAIWLLVIDLISLIASVEIRAYLLITEIKLHKVAD